MATAISPSGCGRRRIVCDAGWKATGHHPRPSEPLGLPAVAKLSYSAEHLAIELAADDADITPGTVLSLAVGYADSTVFLHRRIFTTRGGRVEGVLALPVPA